MDQHRDAATIADLPIKQVLDGKVSDGRRITGLIHAPDSDLGEGDVLYVAGASPSPLRSILGRAGGMVGLVRSGDKIEIEVNLRALRRRNLDMSSRLLKLAVLVPAGGGSR